MPTPFLLADFFIPAPGELQSLPSVLTSSVLFAVVWGIPPARWGGGDL